MKQFFASLSSFIVAVLALVGLYYGHFHGVEWAYNVTLFYYWALSLTLTLCGVLMLFAGDAFKIDCPKKKPGFINWLRGTVMGLVAIGLLAATGHFVLASFTVFAFITVKVIGAKQRKLWEESQKAESFTTTGGGIVYPNGK